MRGMSDPRSRVGRSLPARRPVIAPVRGAWGPLARGTAWAALVAGGALVTGCHLLSGLGDLEIGETSTGGGGQGGSGATGGTAGNGGGTGGTGGATTTNAESCSDSVKNGTETDTDCGGPDCAARCVLGRTCAASSDCESGICRDEKCAGVAKLAAGNAHACALLTTRELFCWGNNVSGQLGLGDTTARPTPELVAIAAELDDVVAGGLPDKPEAHTCARTVGGQVLCWGKNDRGQLGIAMEEDQSAPVQVPGLSGVKAVAAGGAFTCVIDADSKVACWGDDTNDQLGSDAGDFSSVPVPVTSSKFTSVVSLAAGATHACAVAPDGVPYCWGSNGSGQAGNGTTASPAKPEAAVGDVMGASLLRAGQDATCALDATGFRCWGSNADSQLTDAVMADETSTPVALALVDVTAFALGGDGPDSGNMTDGGHGCVVQADQAVCWGANRSGQLGRGTMSPEEAMPAVVNGLGGVVAVAAGTEFTCVVLLDGGVRCWGRNDQGQLGTGMGPASQSSPVPVAWP